MMVSATLEDLTGTVELVAFPRVYDRTKELWAADAIVVVNGKLDVREERFQLIVETVEAFQAGFVMIVGWSVLTCLLIACTRETHCRPAA